MKIAYILFDGITLLDFIGIYDPLSRIKSGNFLPHFDWHLCGPGKTISDSFGLEISVDKVKPKLSTYDMIVIPGGFGTRSLLADHDFLNWIKTAQTVPYKVSICTGSLLLGAAGLLKNKRATTHFGEYEALRPYCRELVKARIVDDKNTITAGAVASSLDLGLYLCEKLLGSVKTETIRKSMDYFPVQFNVVN